VTVLELPQRRRVTRKPFGLALFDGASLAAANWPSITADPDLNMYVYQSREFLDVWMETIGRANHIECFLIVVRDGDDRPVFYLPLAIETKFNVRLLRFMDFGVADYNAPIVANGYTPSRQEFSEVWAEILSLLPSFDVIDLKKIASDVSGAFNPLTSLDRAPYAGSGHAMSLAGLRGDATAQPSLVKLRQDLDRYAKGLKKKCGAPHFVVNPSGPELDQVTERLLELKRDKFKRTNVPDFLTVPGVDQFYRAMMRPDRLGQIGHLSALKVGDEVASAHLGFVGRGRFYYVFPAYDMEYRRHRVGHLLLRCLIDRSIEHDFGTFDLGEGDFPYKDKWATQRLALTTHEPAVTAAGRLYLQMRRVSRFVKAASVRQWFGGKSS
jgi:CelD/BcsL family acetyltransferase involved in cellulose biosynthesis